MRIISLLFFCLATLFVMPPAQAQPVIYVCPEGTYQTQFFGYVGCEPTDGGPQYRSYVDEPLYSGLNDFLPVDLSALKEWAMSNPDADPAADAGNWEFSQSKSKGMGCVAAFTRNGTGVAVMGPTGELPGAFLVFMGRDIPAPKAIKKTKVTLTQSDGGQTVQALNLSMNSAPGIGLIAFQVPTIEALLQNMDDVINFEVAMKGKTVLQIEWQGGKKARDKLRRCVKAG